MLLVTDKDHKITARLDVKSIDKFMYSTSTTMTNKNDSVMFRSINGIANNVSSLMSIGRRMQSLV